jgi:hypothetical protein
MNSSPFQVDPFLPQNHSTPSLHPHYQVSTPIIAAT